MDTNPKNGCSESNGDQVSDCLKVEVDGDIVKMYTTLREGSIELPLRVFEQAFVEGLPELNDSFVIGTVYLEGGVMLTFGVTAPRVEGDNSKESGTRGVLFDYNGQKIFANSEEWQVFYQWLLRRLDTVTESELRKPKGSGPLWGLEPFGHFCTWDH